MAVLRGEQARQAYARAQHRPRPAAREVTPFRLRRPFSPRPAGAARAEVLTPAKVKWTRVR
jgi:hypothetical protein